MRQRYLARELAFVALLGGAVSVGCGLFGKEEASDGGDEGTSGTAGSAGAGVSGSPTGGSAGTGISGSGGLGGSVTTGGSGGAVTTGGSGGSGAGGGAGGGGGMPMVGDISWNETGWIDMTMNTFGVQGPWYSYNDCMDAMMHMVPCTTPDPTLLGPDGMTMGFGVTPAQVCMKGTAAQVMMRPDGGTVDYFGVQWGAGIAFDLNNAGGTATAMPFDATAAGIAGFTFDIIGSAPMTVRINYVMPTTESYAHFVQVAPGPNIEVEFIDVNQGSWVMPPNVVQFDPTQLRTIQFQVFTNDMAPTPYDFCVSNIRVLRTPM